MQQQNAKDCVLRVDLEYLLGLMKLHNNYPLAPDEIKIKREMLSNYQIKIFIIFLKMELQRIFSLVCICYRSILFS